MISGSFNCVANVALLGSHAMVLYWALSTCQNDFNWAKWLVYIASNLRARSSNLPGPSASCHTYLKFLENVHSELVFTV